MQILPATVAQSHTGFHRPVHAGTAQSAGQGADSPSSTVSISAAARQAAAGDRADPLENYRLPEWKASLLPPTTIQYATELDGAIQETRAAGEFLNKLTADGDYSAADRAKMKAYLDANAPINRALRETREFNEAHRSELAEYGGYLDAAWFSSLREQGVESRQDYVDKVLNAPGDNTPLRNSVTEKLLANPRAVQLMDILGIGKPELV